uniref:Uncharacterized protein n=1 Tax=Ixodes ricinus TaxID=34613 RepID=A0A6B0U1N5_IXORI
MVLLVRASLRTSSEQTTSLAMAATGLSWAMTASPFSSTKPVLPRCSTVATMAKISSSSRSEKSTTDRASRTTRNCAPSSMPNTSLLSPWFR